MTGVDFSAFAIFTGMNWANALYRVSPNASKAEIKGYLAEATFELIDEVGGKAPPHEIDGFADTMTDTFIRRWTFLQRQGSA